LPGSRRGRQANAYSLTAREIRHILSTLDENADDAADSTTAPVFEAHSHRDLLGESAPPDRGALFVSDPLRKVVRTFNYRALSAVNACAFRGPGRRDRPPRRATAFGAPGLKGDGLPAAEPRLRRSMLTCRRCPISSFRVPIDRAGTTADYDGGTGWASDPDMYRIERGTGMKALRTTSAIHRPEFELYYDC